MTAVNNNVRSFDPAIVNAEQRGPQLVTTRPSGEAEQAKQVLAAGGQTLDPQGRIVAQDTVVAPEVQNRIGQLPQPTVRADTSGLDVALLSGTSEVLGAYVGATAGDFGALSADSMVAAMLKLGVEFSGSQEEMVNGLNSTMSNTVKASINKIETVRDFHQATNQMKEARKVSRDHHVEDPAKKTAQVLHRMGKEEVLRKARKGEYGQTQSALVTKLLSESGGAPDRYMAYAAATGGNRVTAASSEMALQDGQAARGASPTQAALARNEERLGALLDSPAARAAREEAREGEQELQAVLLESMLLSSQLAIERGSGVVSASLSTGRVPGAAPSSRPISPR